MSEIRTYISLFSSAGVGCYGFKLNGFQCIATNELLSKRLDVQKHNDTCRYDSGYLDGDIATPATKQKLFDEIDMWKKRHKIKEPDVILATPPCQGMSVANHKKKNEKSRNSLVIESIKITREVLPKYFVFENVRAFLTTVCTDVDGVDKSIEAAINSNLGGKYNILSRVVNFKDYGSNSSRTRTLVIGVRKDILNITPYDIFPTQTTPPTLRELIGDLQSLKEMGEITADIFHAYRSFDKRMLPWIVKLKEGQSAFENKDPSRIPHRVINGEIVYNASKNGDKYARWYWDREGPCVHTRNDILASQNTVHPSDNRVFSIRELMRMMSIPDSFEWSEIKTKDLNKLSEPEQRLFLKKHELNIRHCLGEAVPTGVFKRIAANINKAMEKRPLTVSMIKSLVEKHGLDDTGRLVNFLKREFANYALDDLFLIAELSNSQRQHTAAYFTRKDIAYTVVKDLPEFKTKKKIRILEPSVGVGNFLPLLIEKYKDKQEVIIDACDIDESSLLVLEVILGKLQKPANFVINLICRDFLLWDTKLKYDLVVGNPPYKKLTNDKKLLSRYRFSAANSETNNLFAFFIERSVSLGSYVSLIVPKSLLNAPEFNSTRSYLTRYHLEKVCDYGEKGFKGVKIETISFLLKTDTHTTSDDIVIESYITESYKTESKKYLFSNTYPYWLIYRSKFFDKIARTMVLDVFQSFRDRQITKKITKGRGEIRVLKSRNVGNNEIKNLGDYDCYIDSCDHLAVSKYLNQKGIVMVPNLTYYPRGCFLPQNTITDGSVALLTLKNGHRKPTRKDLAYYSTADFENYYRVARNHGTRSLNIDNNSVYFFGLLKG